MPEPYILSEDPKSTSYSPPASGAGATVPSAVAATVPGGLKVIKRNGKVVPYDKGKINLAITKAFLDVEGGIAATSSRVRQSALDLTQQITATFEHRLPSGGSVHIEEIQDQVELSLMRSEHHKVARAYVLYREKRSQLRAEQEEQQPELEGTTVLHVTAADGSRKPLDMARLETVVLEACTGLANLSPEKIIEEALRNLYDGIHEQEVSTSLVISTRALAERDTNYGYVTARLLLDRLRAEVLTCLGLGTQATQAQMGALYPQALPCYLEHGVQMELLDPQLQSFDLQQLGQALQAERDMQFTYLGLQTLYDRYFLQSGEVRFELPQIFFMRVAMGLALQEKPADRDARAIEFYDLLSSFDYMSSTPTLFNAGTLRPQLSSCYLTTVPDHLEGIFGAIRDNALLSKWAGGLGNDWTPVRALGSHIKGTNGKSQGIVPFLKVANDTTVAVNQGGKRKGATCAYLETWHMDIEEFLELRKNTGDDRRRTHDMNTANWVPDLFMERVFEDSHWTLFSPGDTGDLHDLCGQAFKQRYEEYEERAQHGEIKLHKRVRATDLWRKMLGMLFETGHPWITFKDSCNLRSPQQHRGVVHSSNLCTEITLNTSTEEIAVCNLGSVNLANHTNEQGLDQAKLARTVRTAMRMLDDVIDINYYSVPQAKTSNMRHRPVGLGLMGFQDALLKLRIPYASEAAVKFADRSMELLSYHAIESSSLLAEERGAYESFAGSLWSRGVLPADSLALLREQRGGEYLEVDESSSLDWGPLREQVKTRGMRNSNVMAIAPTATIANIVGVSPSIEPTFQNLYVKSNLSGEFTVINPYLVQDLKARDLWDSVMVNDLKYYNGSVRRIDRIPKDLKALYATAFEVEPKWIVEAASRRQKWIDQAQSLNLYIDHADGRKLDVTYRMAWLRGLKTTYYLRTLGATGTEKSTVDTGELNAVAAEQPDGSATPAAPGACSIDDSDCEACQ